MSIIKKKVTNRIKEGTRVVKHYPPQEGEELKKGDSPILEKVYFFARGDRVEEGK